MDVESIGESEGVRIGAVDLGLVQRMRAES